MQSIKDKINIKMIYLFFCISIFISLGKDKILEYNLLFISLIPFMLMGFLNLFYKIKTGLLKKSRTLILWLLFSIVLLLSELQNGNISTSIVLLSIPFFLIGEDLKLGEIVNSMFWGQLPIVLVTGVAAIAGNHFTSNSPGLLVGSMMVSLVSMLILNKEKLTRSMLLLLFVTFFRLIIYINSRTTIVVTIVVTFIGIFHIIYTRYMSKRNIKSNTKVCKIWRYIIIPIMFIIVSLFFYKSVKYILTPKWRPNDISTGRFDIWYKTIQHSTLFGHPYNWYSNLKIFKLPTGPHNLFINILAHSGIVGLIFFTVAIINIITKSFKVYFKEPSSENMITLIFLFASLAKGITEAVLLKWFYDYYGIYIIIIIAILGKTELKDYDNKNIQNNLYKYKSLFYLIGIILIGIGVYGSVFNFNILSITNIINKYI